VKLAQAETKSSWLAGYINHRSWVAALSVGRWAKLEAAKWKRRERLLKTSGNAAQQFLNESQIIVFSFNRGDPRVAIIKWHIRFADFVQSKQKKLCTKRPLFRLVAS
jgi:glutaredoxin 2